MAEPFKIEIYRKKDCEDFTKALADPETRLETGGGAAMTAATAAALMERAAAITVKAAGSNERLDYILRNAEILRGYMVHLIDEDVKSRGPLRRAISEGDPQKIEAAGQTAVSICSEIINMMGKQLELLAELKELCRPEAAHYLRSSAELSMAAMRACVPFILNLSQKNSDETYRYVSRRENEMTLEQFRPIYEKLAAEN